jgi:NAD(P)-dependent dehydrogenase (short-subunit alcohol dehydrogenase family)
MKVMGMIDGKIALVTGSGRGIGAASAKKLGAEGALIVVSDINPTPDEETVAAIRRAGDRAIAVVGDVTDPAFPSRLIGATLDSFGGLAYHATGWRLSPLCPCGQWTCGWCSSTAEQGERLLYEREASEKC